ncbi:unnamed protein product [Zymoseptoria tritici ST99CH_3D1]|uniref:Uncharacterized protein n=1 Tax=Zymoseptoria tritici (strain ST99CH_3D7) TaxID=1276538 RepID=A0A1X7RV47_ZYMT9|nr:unnamed protein product [Zymoseptoria tritici ST99CH_3D7]SMR54911.1 unnamed protein product [Zymoseptoria tritici ST99CH_3D1]
MAATTQSADSTDTSSFTNSQWRRFQASIADELTFKVTFGGVIDTSLLTPEEVASFVVARFKRNQHLTPPELELALLKSLRLDHLAQGDNTFALANTCFEKYQQQVMLATWLASSAQTGSSASAEAEALMRQMEASDASLRRGGIHFTWKFDTATGAPCGFGVSEHDLLKLQKSMSEYTARVALRVLGCLTKKSAECEGETHKLTTPGH